MRQRDLGIDDKLNFGKHNGSTIQQMMYSELSYLRWAIDEKIISLNDEAYTMLANMEDI